MKVRFGYAMRGKNFNSFPSPPRRGGSGSAALSNTLEVSQYPTSPPQSSFKGGVPKIGGSEGGFIGLLVGLIVVILVCCGIVYYLLRTREHGGRAGNKNHPSSAVAADSKGFFSSMLFKDTRTKKAGWAQQGDEFDYDGDENLLLYKDPSGNLPKFGYGVGYADVGNDYTKLDEQRNLRDTTKPSEGVDTYTDPFDPDRLPESVRKQQAPLPPSTSSASHEPQLPKSTERDGILRESPTTPTFEGGTKFREQF